MGDDYPEAFVTEVTPKEEELVQEAIYHGGTQAKAKQFYEDGMAAAFAEMHRVLRPDGIAVIMFAHKKSSAWETLVSALIRAGFQITASWPLNTEGRRLQSYRAVALASSVYLVCRKRKPTQPPPGKGTSFPPWEGGVGGGYRLPRGHPLRPAHHHPPLPGAFLGGGDRRRGLLYERHWAGAFGFQPVRAR